MTSKILVIDDDPGVQRFIRHALESDGYDVISAEDGLHGLLSAGQEQPDLTVLDVMLPGVDGLEVCHRLKSDPRTSGAPVLMLSGKGCEIDKDAGDKVGADQYMVKPVDLPEFLGSIKKLLSS